jgi:hypothetical protein
MKKSLASIMTVLSTALGLALLAMGLMSVTLSQESYRPLLVLTFYGGALAMLGLEALLARRADSDYRQLFFYFFGLAGIGLVLLGLFFSVMWIFLSPRVYAIFLAVLPSCYGLALILAASAHHYLAQRDWRPYLYDFFRQLPYVYWRYRI